LNAGRCDWALTRAPGGRTSEKYGRHTTKGQGSNHALSALTSEMNRNDKRTRVRGEGCKALGGIRKNKARWGCNPRRRASHNGWFGSFQRGNQRSRGTGQKWANKKPQIKGSMGEETKKRAKPVVIKKGGRKVVESGSAKVGNREPLHKK